MEIRELLDIANKNYPDGFLSNYYDNKGNYRKNTGDGLASFIVEELIETFDPRETDKIQLQEAEAILERVAQDIQHVLEALANVLYFEELSPSDIAEKLGRRGNKNVV